MASKAASKAKATAKQAVSQLSAKAGAAAGAAIGTAVGVPPAVGSFIGRQLGKYAPALAAGAKDLVVGSMLSVGAFAAGVSGVAMGGLPTALAMNMVIAIIAAPLMVAFFLLIITSGAYIVPPASPIIGLGFSSFCPAQDAPKPEATAPIFSSDGQYAFPIDTLDQNSYSCVHWDGGVAVDIMAGAPTGLQLPVLAYTSGTIYKTSETDPLGGKYIILAGDDGRAYYYAHNCALYVSAGQRVGVGEVMATTDNTGSAFGTPEHVHFAINGVGVGNSFLALGGKGTVCPQTDFEDQFQFGKCSVGC